MKVTVCQLSNDTSQLEKAWEELVFHCRAEQSELVLLPEMPFYPWIAHQEVVNEVEKQVAIDAHEQWIRRFDELGDAIVAYSKPEMVEGKFLNTACIWTRALGHQPVHSKCFFPEEAGFYEETWFDRGEETFELIEVNGMKIGFLLCTEIWFTQYTRAYGQEGIDFLLVPRATGHSSVDQWVRCGQTSAVIGGCYCLSANRSGVGVADFQWGGNGWIAQPEDGQLLGITTDQAPFLTLDLSLEKTKAAKVEYPVYVRE